SGCPGWVKRGNGAGLASGPALKLHNERTAMVGSRRIGKNAQDNREHRYRQQDGPVHSFLLSLLGKWPCAIEPATRKLVTSPRHDKLCQQVSKYYAICAGINGDFVWRVAARLIRATDTARTLYNALATIM